MSDYSFCGDFPDSVRDHPDYKPGADDFARVTRAAELFARAGELWFARGDEGALSEEERTEMHGLARDFHRALTG